MPHGVRLNIFIRLEGKSKTCPHHNRVRMHDQQEIETDVADPSRRICVGETCLGQPQRGAAWAERETLHTVAYEHIQFKRFEQGTSEPA